jgi:hypothetical protein
MAARVEFSVLLIFLACHSIIQAATFKKEFNKSYEVNANALLDLNSSHSNVTIEHWPNSEISIAIEVIATASTQEKAERIFNQMDIELTGNKSLVQIQIETGSQDGKDGKFEVKLILRVPNSTSLRLKNSFGDISLTEVNGKVVVDLLYGDLRANGIMHPLNEIIISFGTATIHRFGGGEVRCEFGNAVITELLHDATIETYFGELFVKKITPACEAISLDAEFGNITANLSGDSSLAIIASTWMGHIYPPTSISSEIIETNWESSSLATNTSAGKGRLTARSSFGNVRISAD